MRVHKYILLAIIFISLVFTTENLNDDEKYPDMSDGYDIPSDDIVTVEQPDEYSLPVAEDLCGDIEPDIIEEAQAWCDTYSPYAYGGNGENGPGSSVDCSAFTKAVYEKLGVTLPRISYDQAKVGTRVSYTPGDYSCLLPGDLVIMNNYGHCGIYAGDGMVIHASSSGGKVVKVPMSNFSSGFVNEVRRILQ